jgi:hypothetical protein
MNKTRWFRDARWGIFVHYLASTTTSDGPVLTPELWNAQMDAFDIPGLVAQLQHVGAKYIFLTLGQNSGYFCSPNETYDHLVERNPSRLSRRDLVGELADALDQAGIRAMVYLPSHAPAYDIQAVENLACTPPWDASGWQLKPGTYLNTRNTDERLSTFQRNWEAVIREWSLRWGTKVHGWWFDGCYFADRMYRNQDEPNFASMASAARAGNPNSIVAFNPGVTVPVIRCTQYEDYTAGEISSALPVKESPRDGVQDGYIEGAQYHILTYLGESWGQGKPRFPRELVLGYTKMINDLGGVVTWDVPIDKNGRIPQDHLEVLKQLRR